MFVITLDRKGYCGLIVLLWYSSLCKRGGCELHWVSVIVGRLQETMLCAIFSWCACSNTGKRGCSRLYWVTVGVVTLGNIGSSELWWHSVFVGHYALRYKLFKVVCF